MAIHITELSKEDGKNVNILKTWFDNNSGDILTKTEIVNGHLDIYGHGSEVKIGDILLPSRFTMYPHKVANGSAFINFGSGNSIKYLVKGEKAIAIILDYSSGGNINPGAQLGMVIGKTVRGESSIIMRCYPSTIGYSDIPEDAGWGCIATERSINISYIPYTKIKKSNSKTIGLCSIPCCDSEEYMDGVYFTVYQNPEYIGIHDFKANINGEEYYISKGIAFK